MHYRAPSVLLSVALAATAVVAADLVVFGPQTYTRGVDRPVEVKKTFPVSRPSGQFMLRVVNHGVTSAIITLNGRTILEPKDFTLKRGRPWRDDEWERHTGGWDDDHHGADDPDGRNRDDRDRAGRDRDDRFDHDDEQPVSFSCATGDASRRREQDRRRAARRAADVADGRDRRRGPTATG